MNCQEVMEFMQRHLDLDLNEEEQRLLEQHIAGCSSCQEMMGRLQRLTEELTNLPKVYPPVSLVDAIMPKLVEIDNMNQAGTASAQNVDSETRMDRSSRRQRRIPYTMLGGVVAAGILLGVMIVNWDDLRPAERMQASDAAEVAASDYSTARSVVHNAGTSSDDPSSGGAPPQAGNEIQSMADPQVQYTAEQYNGEEVTIKFEGSSSSDSGASGDGVGVSGLNTSSVGDRPPEGARERYDVQDENKQVTEGSSTGNNAEQADILLGSLHHLDQAGLISPNNEYLAYIEDDRIVILNAAQEVVYTSQTYTDIKLGSLQWQDDARLTFKAGVNSNEAYYIDLSSEEEGVLEAP